MSSKLNVTLHCHIFLLFTYKSKQAFIQQPHKVLLEISLVFIIINKLNTDQAL